LAQSRDDFVATIDGVESLTSSRGRALAAVAGLLAAMVVAARFLVPLGTPAASNPQAAPPQLVQEPEQRVVVVHVVGAVRRPGLYRLRFGARVADAVRRAGGPAARADTQLVNLAAPVVDGEQVIVPAKQPRAGAPDTGSAPPGPGSAPVHLSTATLEELDALPGVGPVTAQKIVDYRKQHGAFTSVAELDAIPGIGPARLEQLRDLVAP
jgi:competence protein ComEA